jgi:hypothetical protein
MGVVANSNVSSNKCVTIMAIKPNQLKITTLHPQANAIIERVHKVNDMLRSFDLENNHENLETQGQEDNPFDYFMVTMLLEAPITQHCRQHHVNLCLAEILSTILPSV